MKSVGLFKICHEKPNYTEVEQMQNARLILPKLQVYIHTTGIHSYQEIYRSKDQRGNCP